MFNLQWKKQYLKEYFKIIVLRERSFILIQLKRTWKYKNIFCSVVVYLLYLISVSDSKGYFNKLLSLKSSVVFIDI